jgi:outer membrane autotransporter protein
VSVGEIQHLRDVDQAVRTLDSLSGHGYAAATDALLQQAATPVPELIAHIGNLHDGSASGSWSTQMAMMASGAGAFSGERAGFDQWLDDRLLLGSSFGWSKGNLRFDRSGGTARDQSPQWDVYWRRNGNGNSYLFGDIGYSRHQMNFNRQIDLGITRQTAGTQRNLDVMRAWVEAGRDFRVGRSWLTPFGALSYVVLHGASFTEQGSTGLELIAQPSMHQRFSAAAGLRLGTDWLSSSGRWMKLNLTAGYRQLLQADDDARAAFTGTPEVTSVLGGMPRQRNTGWLQMNLATGGTRWDWLLSYDRQAGDDALSLGATFKF